MSMTSVMWFDTDCLNLLTPDGLPNHDLTEVEKLCAIHILYIN